MRWPALHQRILRKIQHPRGPLERRVESRRPLVRWRYNGLYSSQPKPHAAAGPPSGRHPPRAHAVAEKLCSDEGLFALGASVARVVQLVDADDQGTQSLAYYVLSDVALTQKILRLANTPTYRPPAAPPSPPFPGDFAARL